MRQLSRLVTVFAVPLAVIWTFGSTITASAAAARTPSILHVGQIDRQDVATQDGCENDTLVEPDIAVSPFNADIAVAVAHDCRFSNGGAVDISYAWTHDGGAHWHHAPLPQLTKAVGGPWDRASDPVAAFGADGSVFIAALVFDATTCPTGVTVSRSTDGGATFAAPVTVQKSLTCAYSDDKDWLTVDTQPTSPFYGRLYVFWTPFISNSQGRTIGVPQVVRWSDDSGATWSSTHLVTGKFGSTQNSQPMIQPDGRITDVYLRYSSSGGASGMSLYARTSHDGGATWSQPFLIAHDIGVGPADIRCCLPASAADPVTGELYTVWPANAAGEAVELSHSTDGHTWSAPVQVTKTGSNPAIQHVNAAVAAYHGHVFVTYGTRNTSQSSGRYVQQQVSPSYDGGLHFAAPISLGPLSDLKYAAVAQGKFPGDYIGISETASVVAIVWCVSSQPPNPNQAYHQTLYAAELRP